jgi:Amt family ammonium transporter
VFGGVGYVPGVGMAGQAVTQVLGVAATMAWSGVATLALAVVVKRLVGLRARDEAIDDGLDVSAHGERAWNP